MKNESIQSGKINRKRGQGKMIVLFLLYVTLTVLGLTLFKLGHIEMSVDASSFGFLMNWKSLLGICCYMLSFIFWLAIVSRGELSFVMPLSAGLVNLAVVFSAYLILHEKILPLQWTGIFVVAIGLVLMNWRR